MTARVAVVTTDETGTRVITRWSEGQTSGTEDALDLARRCVAAWDDYLKQNGTHSPI